MHALTIIYILHRAEEKRREEKRKEKEDSRVAEFILTLFYKYLSMGKKMSLKDKVACFSPSSFFTNDILQMSKMKH